MKKLLSSAAAVVGSSFVALAQEQTSSNAASMAGDIAEQAQTSLLEMLNTVAPVIVAVVVAGLGIWGGIALVGIIKRGFNAGKGR